MPMARSTTDSGKTEKSMATVRAGERVGTYTYANGDTFEGEWVDNARQGRGRADGDV